MAEVKYHQHHAGNTPAERLRSRERNSGCDTADVTMKPSQGARFHNIHWRGQPPAGRRVDLNQGGDPTKQDGGGNG